MKEKNKHLITVKTVINAPIKKVWKNWTTPEDIKKWNAASNDWHTKIAVNNLKPNGRFNYRMEAKDGSFGFDFSGVYKKIKAFEKIEFTLDDARKVSISFISSENQTEIIENFETENENSPELQKNGWQAILNNFKKYVESMN